MINEEKYTAIAERVEELLLIVDNDTPKDNEAYVELEILSNMMADYEDEHYQI